MWRDAEDMCNLVDLIFPGLVVMQERIQWMVDGFFLAAE